jgi:putative phosphoribosyl transferase
MTSFVRFRNRVEAGRRLANALREYANRQDVLILALPRGGVPVGYEVAKALDAPLDIFLVRKLGVPGGEELAMGAIASGGVKVLNEEVIRLEGISDRAIESVYEKELEELRRRELAYRGNSAPQQIRDMTVILVDDGIATGSTMRAAVTALRRQRPSKLIVAVPTAPRSSCVALQLAADDVVVVMTPEPFFAVSQSYDIFGQTSDEEVRELFERSKRRVKGSSEHSSSDSSHDRKP